MSESETPTSATPIYANGFAVYVGASDVTVNLMLGGRPTHELHLSYTSAKTLGAMLTQMVVQLEAKTGSNIMTIGDVAGHLAKEQDEN